jgi:hypothetical protein
MPDTRLILHVKGTESQTAEIPKAIVRAGIAQGQISRSQLIWSATHNAWKQVRELPHLLPSQKLAPAPAPRVGTVPLPKPAVGEAAVQTGAVPKVAVKVSGGRAVPPGFKATRPAAKSAAAQEHDMVVKEVGGVSYLKLFCIGLALLIVALIGANYLLVDRPISSTLSKTPYANVSVYAHLGAFVQPGALVIHIPPSAGVTSANLPEFLQVLAHSTPDAPLGGGTFDEVSLTTGWTGHYCFTGYAWKEYGDMSDQDDEHKQAFLLDQLKDASGQPLLSPGGSIDPNAQQSERDKLWTEFVTYFAK